MGSPSKAMGNLGKRLHFSLVSTRLLTLPLSVSGSPSIVILGYLRETR